MVRTLVGQDYRKVLLGDRLWAAGGAVDDRDGRTPVPGVRGGGTDGGRKMIE